QEGGVHQHRLRAPGRRGRGRGEVSVQGLWFLVPRLCLGTSWIARLCLAVGLARRSLAGSAFPGRAWERGKPRPSLCSGRATRNWLVAIVALLASVAPGQEPPPPQARAALAAAECVGLAHS